MNTALYLSVSKQIADNVPAIKHIDLFNQQYIPSIEGKTAAYIRPAVFIEFGPTQWDNTCNSIQEGQGSMKVHVVLENYKDSANLQTKTTDQQTKALLYFGIPAQVQKALQGYLADGINDDLNRINTTPDNNHDNLIVEIMEYEFTDRDASADTEQAWTSTHIDHIVINRGAPVEVEVIADEDDVVILSEDNEAVQGD